MKKKLPTKMIPPDEQHSSSENHELLLSLSTQLRSFDGRLGDYIVQSDGKFTLINSRIDVVQDSFRKMVDELKDTLAARGRMSSGFIFSLIAVLVSTMALVGGSVSAYINVRLGNITPIIESHADKLNSIDAQLFDMRGAMVQFEKDNIRNDAESKEARRWLEKTADSNSQKIRELELKKP